MDECKHGLDRIHCTDCKLPPVGINSTVYITKGGFAFHNKKDCAALVDGQTYAERNGMEVHPIRAVQWSHIAPDRQGCLICCTPQEQSSKFVSSTKRVIDGVNPTSSAWQSKSLRHGGKCTSCGTQLERYEIGWHNPELKIVRCEKCGAPSISDSIDEVRNQVETKRNSVGGSSALSQGKRRHDHNYIKGAAGEYLLDRFLHQQLNENVVILADRRVPRRDSNIDHIVIASSGVWLIDSKNWRGKIEYKTASLMSMDYRLYVGGKDHTYLFETIYSQVIPVAEIIDDYSVPIQPAVVFINGDWAVPTWWNILRNRPLEHLGVFLTTPETVAHLLNEPGTLDAATVSELGTKLDQSLRPR